jgi:ABC-2 type transport system permease protein
MRSLFAFMKKEVLEQIRSGKVIILGLLFTLFGIMNPAVAKLTPWLLETMSDSLAESGMSITVATVSAMDSWMQFFKNIPMALIAFVLLESSIFTKEYQRGTLILSLTKGLRRYKIVVSKAVVLTVLWTAAYWLCFGITYGYNAYFWDNAVAKNLGYSVLCWWLFGLWVMMLTLLFSVMTKSNIGALGGTGAVVFVSYLLGLLPKLSKYLPTTLADGNSLIHGMAEVKAYMWPLIITVITGVICFVISIPIFNRQEI